MRRSKSVASLVIAVGIGAMVAFGAASAYAAGTSTAAAGKTGATAPKGNIISGEVTAVNADGKSLTIKDRGKDVQVTWTDATTFSWKASKGKPEPATLGDLKTGEHVSVKAEKSADGNYTALSVWIYKAMEHKTKEMKTAPTPPAAPTK